MELENKIAIVTGGARGIGAAIADRYVAEGANRAMSVNPSAPASVATSASNRTSSSPSSARDNAACR
jgi:NAD(P)-dependent dehydrogenase (short-subunit alcohol dehydrogenase family)